MKLRPSLMQYDLLDEERLSTVVLISFCIFFLVD